jgi:Na+-translocating ferredoxin:NAD+ oxidoreductase RnfG subunit
MQPSDWMLSPVALVSSPAYAATYLTVEQAQAAMFPGAQLTRAFVTLTGEQVAAIEKETGVNVRTTEVQRWKSADGGSFIVDEVAGKHEFFTIAVALNADSRVRQIEIMDYKESYGCEVRDEAWRQQLTGKTSAASLSPGDDIKNISGATMSCRHVTDAVKRVLATYYIAIEPS